MSKNKQQKKKERERRVAQKKYHAAQKERAEGKAAKENQKTVPVKTKLMAEAVPKTDYVPVNKKSPFTQRRGGG